MCNIKLIIEYDGTDYCGWQRQNSLKLKAESSKQKNEGASRNVSVRAGTIQTTLENAIYKVTGEKVNLIASGRTDAGVHAKEQVANFKLEKEFNLEKLKYSFNSVLPYDILINDVEKVDKNFHARYHVKRKKYRYSIMNSQFCSPFYKRFYTHITYPLDFKLIRKESKNLIGRHDFKSFQSAGSNIKGSTIREVYRLDLKKDIDIIAMDIEANGFLYNMVRSIIGTLIEIGRGKLPPGSMKKILKSKNRKSAGPTAPSQGLCLIKTTY